MARSLSLSLFASGGPCQGGRLRAARANLSLSADCPSGQDPPEADEKDASGGPCGQNSKNALELKNDKKFFLKLLIIKEIKSQKWKNG